MQGHAFKENIGTHTNINNRGGAGGSRCLVYMRLLSLDFPAEQCSNPKHHICMFARPHLWRTEMRKLGALAMPLAPPPPQAPTRQTYYWFQSQLLFSPSVTGCCMFGFALFSPFASCCLFLSHTQASQRPTQNTSAWTEPQRSSCFWSPSIESSTADLIWLSRWETRSCKHGEKRFNLISLPACYGNSNPLILNVCCFFFFSLPLTPSDPSSCWSVNLTLK